MYKYTNCPVCKNQNFQPYMTCEDHTVSHEKFTIVSCDACNFKFTNPIPEIQNLGNYYKSEDYISHSNTKKGIVSQVYHLVRNYTLKQKLDLVSSYVSRGTLLDYGCGTGMFLNVCQKAGWNAMGMEPDSGARNIGSGMGLQVYENKEALLSAKPEVRFNAITLWHVLEHVTDLEETLRFFKTHLNRNGVLIIAVPNYTSFDAEHYKEHWAAYDLPRHLYHFEVHSISRLMKTAGFVLEKTLPMKFDSFYVSLLSEKYKTGKVRFLNAFFTGLRSNLKAKKAEHYSSVIYVFKPQ
jgi:SAM-dependent methyltransferase